MKKTNFLFSMILLLNFCSFDISAQSLAISFNTTLTTAYLKPPAVSGVINDPTDPALNDGIVVNVTNSGSPIAAADYTLTAASSKTSVVANADVTITKADGNATVKIKPKAVGYADITLTLKLASGGSSKTLKINYAASAASSTPANTFWHTGYSDASACIALDSNYMVMADDEINLLHVTPRHQSGLAVKTFDFTNNLGLTDGSSEVDIEACVRSIKYPNRVYWTGSMSNAGSSNKYKPNSNTLFTTDITGTGTNTSFAVKGHYNSLRQKLVTWGDNNGFNFTKSTEDGHDAKTIDGFNVEGMTLAPDNTTLYIGFRAPLVPSTSATPTSSNRTMAVIAPILNFETWFLPDGSPGTSPTFGTPIKLDLGGRGIRDMVKLSSGIYIIVAGKYDGSDPTNGAIYQWTGNAADAPTQIPSLNITALNAEAVLEIDDANGNIRGDRLEVISDNGSFEFYNDGTEAKDLDDNEYKKYRSDIIIASSNVVPVTVKYFTAQKQNNNAVLNWAVTGASDPKTFEILRSSNGKDFLSLQTESALIGKTVYSYTDVAPSYSTVYYKVKIVDNSGSVFYTNINTINFGNSTSIKIYPNPITNNSFTVSNGQMGIKHINVYDSKGALVRSISSFDPSVNIDGAAWNKGIYIVEVLDGAGKVLGREAVVK